MITITESENMCRQSNKAAACVKNVIKVDGKELAVIVLQARNSPQ